MKQTKDIDKLIVAVLSGQANEEERQQLDDWTKQSEQNQIHFDYLKQIWEEKSSEPKFIHADELADKIWERGVDGINRKVIWKRRSAKSQVIQQLLKIAAVIAIPAIASIWYFINETGNADPVTEEQEQVLIKKENPAGQKSKFILSDGSVVWMNAESSIVYADYFSDTARVIELKGEAYFEVKKDSLRPFIVKSGNIHTVAIGTSFNVRANLEEDDIRIGLISGKVNVKDAARNKSLTLYPGQGVIYNKPGRHLKELRVDSEDVVAWKEGILIFDGENFTDFVQQLEKWYGVKIRVLGTPPTEWRIRGRFDNEYLNNILKSISFNKAFKYEINKKNVKLMFN